jgi:hypothetical protein
MTIKVNIGRKTLGINGMEWSWSPQEGGGPGSLENSEVAGKGSLKFRVYRVYWGCLNCLNGMELGNDARMTFF